MAPRIQPPSASDDLYPEPSPSNTSLPWPEMPLQGQAARPQGQEHGDPHNENCGLCALRDFKRRFEPQSGAKPDGVDKRAVPLVFGQSSTLSHDLTVGRSGRLIPYLWPG